jgi:hypothetical protein
MEISELNESDRLKALEYQINAKYDFDKDTDVILDAFKWRDTKEGDDYWGDLHNSISQIKLSKEQTSVIPISGNFEFKEEVLNNENYCLKYLLSIDNYIESNINQRINSKEIYFK